MDWIFGQYSQEQPLLILIMYVVSGLAIGIGYHKFPLSLRLVYAVFFPWAFPFFQWPREIGLGLAAIAFVIAVSLGVSAGMYVVWLLSVTIWHFATGEAPWIWEFWMWTVVVVWILCGIINGVDEDTRKR